jgi:GDPmannose 4,6-dehydratase
MAVATNLPMDLVIGTGVAHSIADFYELAFRRVGLKGSDYVTVDPALIRQGDAPLRLADPTLARTRLGWTPEVDFERLVEMMVDHEMGDGRRET